MVNVLVTVGPNECLRGCEEVVERTAGKAGQVQDAGTGGLDPAVRNLLRIAPPH